MTSRTTLAWLIVAGWVLALGWNARREVFRSAAERLALGAATLPPGAAYYTVDAGDSPVGMASVEVDTLPGGRGFMVTERYTVELPGLGAAGRVETRGETWLGRRVAVDSLTRSIVRGDDTVRVRAFITGGGDSLRWEGPGDTLVVALAAPGRLQIAASWPLRYAAAGGTDPGARRRISMLDPVTGTLREVELVTQDEAVRVFADSADTDPRTGEWIVAGQDTVRAWRIVIDDGTATDTWVDEDGRLVEAPLPGGLHMRRTAFELAFFRDGSPVDSSGAGAGSPADSAGTGPEAAAP